MEGVFMNHIAYIGPVETKSDIFHLFDLEEIHPGCKLLVNISMSIVSLLPKEPKQEALVVAQRILSASEMRVLLPLLTFLPCCPQEVLQASYFCEYTILLQALFSTDVYVIAQWDKLVQEHRLRLTDASQRKTRHREMKGVYNALFALRHKLEQLDLSIRSRQDGFYLSPLAHHKPF
jgi:hypothetical protein